MYGQMGGRTDKQNFSPFYRTLSPVRAAAQKLLSEMFKEVAKVEYSGYWGPYRSLGGECWPVIRFCGPAIEV